MSREQAYKVASYPGACSPKSITDALLESGVVILASDLRAALSGCREPHKHVVCALEAVAEARALLREETP